MCYLWLVNVVKNKWLWREASTRKLRPSFSHSMSNKKYLHKPTTSQNVMKWLLIGEKFNPGWALSGARTWVNIKLLSSNGNCLLCVICVTYSTGVIVTLRVSSRSYAHFTLRWGISSHFFETITLGRRVSSNMPASVYKHSLAENTQPLTMWLAKWYLASITLSEWWLF